MTLVSSVAASNVIYAMIVNKRDYNVSSTFFDNFFVGSFICVHSYRKNNT